MLKYKILVFIKVSSFHLDTHCKDLCDWYGGLYLDLTQTVENSNFLNYEAAQAGWTLTKGTGNVKMDANGVKEDGQTSLKSSQNYKLTAQYSTTI